MEATFTTQMNYQAPLEPDGCVAYMEGEGEDAQLVVIGRSINIHDHMANLQEALGWENMRYEEAFSGGQFGIKAAITSEGIAGGRGPALQASRPLHPEPCRIHASDQQATSLYHEGEAGGG